MNSIDPRILAAIISVITSIITVAVATRITSFYDKRNYISRLENEHKFEQRKKLKDILSKNKIQLINNCEQLNHRLWNLSINHAKGWHSVGGNYTNAGYYFSSFVYRVACLYAWIKKIEDEMIYLDTTIALKEDMDFVKYLRLLPQLLWDVRLFEGLDGYDVNIQSDHMFRYNLEDMAQYLLENGQVCTYSKFLGEQERHLEKLRYFCQFIDGISPNEDRPRWDRLQIIHIAVIAFLNAFGYDFQITSQDQLKELLARNRKNKFFGNFIGIINKNKLGHRKELKNVIEVLNTV